MKAYFEGKKKFNILLINLVFFITSSNLAAVSKLPSKISLMMCLYSYGSKYRIKQIIFTNSTSYNPFTTKRPIV